MSRKHLRKKKTFLSNIREKITHVFPKKKTEHKTTPCLKSVPVGKWKHGTVYITELPSTFSFIRHNKKHKSFLIQIQILIRHALSLHQTRIHRSFRYPDPVSVSGAVVTGARAVSDSLRLATRHLRWKRYDAVSGFLQWQHSDNASVRFRHLSSL